MKITKRGIYIEDIGTDGVETIESGDSGVTVTFEWPSDSRTWSRGEVRNLIEALQAAIGEQRPISNDGPWETPERIPAHLTEVYDCDGDLMVRYSHQTWPEALQQVSQYAPWRAKR